MTKKEFLLGLLEKLQYSDDQPLDNMTNGLIGLISAVENDDTLLDLVERIITESMKQTLTSVRESQLKQSLQLIQKIKQQELSDENDDLNALLDTI